MDENYLFSMKKSTLGTGSMRDLDLTSNNQMVWSIMRTAYLIKQELKKDYQAEAFFYTIGLGVTSNYGEFMLNPSKGINTLKSGTQYDRSLYNYMREISKEYIYPTASFTGKMSSEELKNIFVDIATEVTEATKVISLCITIDDLKKEGYLSKDSKINDELAKNTYVIISENAATNQYVFSIAKTEEQKQQCQSLLAE